MGLEFKVIALLLNYCMFYATKPVLQSFKTLKQLKMKISLPHKSSM